MTQTIIVLDFGSQYTQVIARRIREAKVYSKVLPFNTKISVIKKLNPNGIVLSGGPASVLASGAPKPKADIFSLGVPILGICYGLQLMGTMLGGEVKSSDHREYGRGKLKVLKKGLLFKDLPSTLTVWNSHGDCLVKMPKGFKALAQTENSDFASIEDSTRKFYGLQFHPEVEHSEKGNQIIQNFLFTICKCKGDWDMEDFTQSAIQEIKNKVGKKKVILGLSGGVDSSVAAALIHRAIGDQLTCIFVDNGLLRLNEREQVDKEVKSLGKVDFLAQGTLYPDVIESVPIAGNPASLIKSHHNVGGLPKRMKLSLLEPLRELFKDEVRNLGRALDLSENVLMRHPFPGPGLGVRVVGSINSNNLRVLREADSIFIDELRSSGWYHKLWQAFCVFLPVRSVGVMGDERTYDHVISLRAVTSSDAMTADWAQLPDKLLRKVSNRIINEVKGANRVVYDISSKPPSTIEWE